MALLQRKGPDDSSEPWIGVPPDLSACGDSPEGGTPIFYSSFKSHTLKFSSSRVCASKNWPLGWSRHGRETATAKSAVLHRLKTPVTRIFRFSPTGDSSSWR